MVFALARGSAQSWLVETRQYGGSRKRTSIIFGALRVGFCVETFHDKVAATATRNACKDDLCFVLMPRYNSVPLTRLSFWWLRAASGSEFQYGTLGFSSKKQTPNPQPSLQPFWAFGETQAWKEIAYGALLQPIASRD